MSQHHADLLIGGDRLKNLAVDLAYENQTDGSQDWRFAGQLHLSPDQTACLKCGRTYRLQLPDGRGGQVEIAEIAQGNGDLLANFQPRK